MSVHMLKDGRWIVQYRDPEAGNKYKREYFGRGPVAEADARKRDSEHAHREYIRRTPSGSRSPLFKELCEGYLKARMADMQNSSYSVLEYKLEALLLPEFGNIPAINISKERVDSYVAKRLAAGKSTGTIRRDIADIQAIMNYGAERGLIPHNPISGYKKPRPDPAIIAPPTLTEMIGINKHAPEHLQRALKIIFYTGCRPGSEITSLTWANVNWDSGSIRIVSAKKHGLKYRDVPIFKEFRTLLETWQEEDKARIKKAEEKKRQDSRTRGFKGSSVYQELETSDQEPETPPQKVADRTIITYQNRPVKSLKRSWGRAKQLAGITRALTPYSYRHAFVSMLLDAGADLKAVSEIVGHSSTAITLQVYQHTNKAMHQRAIEKLPQMAW